MPSVKVNGVNLFYMAEGQGEPLVLIAGFAGGYKSWMYQTPVFKRYFQVISFDNRGSMGNSDKPPRPYTINMMVKDTIGLMDYLRIQKAHICGMSMGGAVAQEIAINYPERVSKLILVSTWSHNSETCGLSPSLKKAADLPVPKMVSKVMHLALNNIFYKLAFIPLFLYQAKHDNLITDAGILGQRDACLGHNTIDRLHLINVPTIVITGTKDRCVMPISADYLTKRIPGSRLIEIKNGSHTLGVESRKIFNNVVMDFLRL